MPVCLCAEQLTETSESWHLTTKQIFKLGFSTSITIITTKIGKEENSNCSCLVISPWWFYIMLFLQPVMYITKWNVAAPVNLLRRHRPRFCKKNSEIEIDFMSNSNQKKIGRLLTFPDMDVHIGPSTPANLQCKKEKTGMQIFSNIAHFHPNRSQSKSDKEASSRQSPL